MFFLTLPNTLLMLLPLSMFLLNVPLLMSLAVLRIPDIAIPQVITKIPSMQFLGLTG